MIPPKQYAEHSNREKFVMVQIEDFEAHGLADEALGLARITSYNVCYTKLLRTAKRRHLSCLKAVTA